MTTSIKIVLWCLAAYGVYCLLGFVFQRQVVFPRHYAGGDYNRQPDLPGLEVEWLSTSFGRVEAWLLKPTGMTVPEPMPVILFAHGNAETIDSCAAELLPLTRLGCAVLLPEYPGYGRSAGKPSQKRIVEALSAALNWAVARNDIDADRVVLMGRSIGGGAICATAAQKPGAALILVSTFTSLRAMTAKFLLPGFLVRDPFDNLAALADYPNPILIFHGRFDEIVPYRHGQALHRAAPASEMITYDCGHNDLPPDDIRFRQDIRAFLQKAGIFNH